MEIQLDSDTARYLDELAKATARPQGELAAQLLTTYLRDLQTWTVEAVQQALDEADRGQLTAIEHIRQTWENKRAHAADAQR